MCSQSCALHCETHEPWARDFLCSLFQSRYYFRNLVTDMKWLKGDNIIAQTAEDKMLKLWDARILEVLEKNACA